MMMAVVLQVRAAEAEELGGLKCGEGQLRGCRAPVVGHYTPMRLQPPRTDQGPQQGAHRGRGDQAGARDLGYIQADLQRKRGERARREIVGAENIGR